MTSRRLERRLDRLIIGVDPGKMCGFAVLDGDVFTSDDLTWDDACSRLHALLRRGQPTIVAVERFTFQASSSKMTRQYDALEFIGVARYLCAAHTAILLVQGASEAQRVGSPTTLRALSWWRRGFDHANKAAAQVTMALARTHPVEFEDLLAPGIM